MRHTPSGSTPSGPTCRPVLRPIRRTASRLAAATALVTLGGLLTAPAATAAPRATAVGLNVSQDTARSTEAVVLRGRVRIAGGGAPGRARVRIKVRRPGERFRTVLTVRTGPKGRFFVQHRPYGARDYRAVVVRDSQRRASRSPIRRVTERQAGRTIAQRARLLRPRIGAATGAVRVQKRYGARVAARPFQRGLVVRWGRNASLVERAVLKEYRRRGGVGGRLGAPVADVDCQGLDRACLQLFQRGAIYIHPNAPHRVTTVLGPRRKAALIAAARAWAGYREPSYRGGKFSHWQGNRNAWCGSFLSWASHASGNGEAFPRSGVFSEQVRIIRSRGRTHQKPKVGSFAFIDYFGTGRPTHVGLVTGVRRDGRIELIEGNVAANGGTGHPRGVFPIVRSRGAVLFYAAP